MIKSKNAYLKKLTEKIQIKSVKVGKNIEGSTPPSVFIGNWNYPKVYAGPMMIPEYGDSSIADSPELWINEGKTQEDILNYRLNLVRGKQLIVIDELENPLVEKLQEISLASKSTDSEAKFGKVPRGKMLTEDSMPHGPSAIIKEFDIDAVKWDKHLEKTYYDSDLKASEALMNLHNKDVPFSRFQKAFSVGAIGTGKKRKLVPTRWSITACDSTIANNLLKEVRHFPILDTYRVYQFSSLKNYYAIILLPMEWQYEWMEAFIKILGKEEMIFSDYETNRNKSEYSSVGGCYYTSKMEILNSLNKQRIQSAAIVLREAYEGYVPLGVFNVRENIKYAMKGEYIEFETLHGATEYLKEKLKIPIHKYVKKSSLLKDFLKSKQTTLDAYLKKSVNN
jgi:hypothetical protein